MQKQVNTFSILSIVKQQRKRSYQQSTFSKMNTYSLDIKYEQIRTW